MWLGWLGAESQALEVLGQVDADFCLHLTGRYLYCGAWDERTGKLTGVRVWRARAG